jgi:hypothetical protein
MFPKDATRHGGERMTSRDRMVLECNRVTNPSPLNGNQRQQRSAPQRTTTLTAHGSLRTMVNRVKLQHRYPVPPERIREVFTALDYLSDKLHAVGGPRAELVSREQDEDGVTIVLHHAVPSDVLPSFLRSVRPQGLTIRRTETWSNSGGSVQAVVDGMPGTITVVMQLAPDPNGCVLGAQLTAEVSLPLFSGKVEKMIIDNVAKLMATEHQFTLDWLRNSAPDSATY